MPSGLGYFMGKETKTERSRLVCIAHDYSYWGEDFVRCYKATNLARMGKLGKELCKRPKVDKKD